MTLETMKELFGVTHVGEEEVPNAKRMHVGEEEVSLSQPVTAAVPPEEEEVPTPPPPYRSPVRGRGGLSPHLSQSHWKEWDALSR
jgi:hypothetical protein